MTTAKPQDSAADFARLIELQQLFASADATFTSLQAQADERLYQTLDATKAEFTSAKAIRDQAEAEIKELTARHPEWLDGKSVKTPFGSVEFRDSTKLDIPNPEATVALIQSEFTKPKSEFEPTTFLRTTVEPNVESLEALDDSALARLGVRRVKSQSTTVKRAKVDLGKVAKADKRPATAKADKGA